MSETTMSDSISASIAPGLATSIELLKAHNTIRVSRGLRHLDMNPDLLRMATAHAGAMAGSGVLSHDQAGDGAFASRLGASGYAFKSGAENIASGYPGVADVMAGWMGSPGHRANVLGDFADAGFALARDGRGRAYWCAVFGRPAISMIEAAGVAAVAGELAPPVRVQEPDHGG